MNLSTEAVASLRDRIAECLAQRQKEQTRLAVKLTGQLPGPSDDPADATAQCFFDAGFSLESFSEERAAVSLYRAALSYRVSEPNVHANAWFRLGLCLERLGSWFEVLDCYRKCLALAHDWPELIRLARLQLADLLQAAEDYAEAAEIFRQSISGPADPIAIKYARCLLRTGHAAEAAAEIRALLANLEDNCDAVEGRQLLAEIHELSGDFEAAAECYASIAASPHADPHVRSAAAHRLSTMPQTKRGKRDLREIFR